jgi:hypothetical protein
MKGSSDEIISQKLLGSQQQASTLALPISAHQLKYRAHTSMTTAIGITVPNSNCNSLHDGGPRHQPRESKCRQPQHSDIGYRIQISQRVQLHHISVFHTQTKLPRQPCIQWCQTATFILVSNGTFRGNIGLAKSLTNILDVPHPEVQTGNLEPTRKTIGIHQRRAESLK